MPLLEFMLREGFMNASQRIAVPAEDMVHEDHHFFDKDLAKKKKWLLKHGEDKFARGVLAMIGKKTKPERENYVCYNTLYPQVFLDPVTPSDLILWGANYAHLRNWYVGVDESRLSPAVLQALAEQYVPLLCETIFHNRRECKRMKLSLGALVRSVAACQVQPLSLATRGLFPPKDLHVWTEPVMGRLQGAGWSWFVALYVLVPAIIAQRKLCSDEGTRYGANKTFRVSSLTCAKCRERLAAKPAPVKVWSTDKQHRTTGHTLMKTGLLGSVVSYTGIRDTKRNTWVLKVQLDREGLYCLARQVQFGKVLAARLGGDARTWEALWAGC